jgi:hypothetical protein
MNEVSVFSIDRCAAKLDRTSNHDNGKCQTEERTGARRVRQLNSGTQPLC